VEICFVEVQDDFATVDTFLQYHSHYVLGVYSHDLREGDHRKGLTGLGSRGPPWTWLVRLWHLTWLAWWWWSCG